MDDIIFNILNVSMVIGVWIAIFLLLYLGYSLYKESEYLADFRLDDLDERVRELEKHLKK